MFSAMCATSVGLFFGQYDRARIERHCCRDIDKSGVDVGKRFNVAGHFFFYRAELVACSARPVATVLVGGSSTLLRDGHDITASASRQIQVADKEIHKFL